jgi:hypothetical protein
MKDLDFSDLPDIQTENLFDKYVISQAKKGKKITTTALLRKFNYGERTIYQKLFDMERLGKLKSSKKLVMLDGVGYRWMRVYEKV